MVNSFDDSIRGLGIKCLAAYLHATASTATSPIDVSISPSSIDTTVSQKEVASTKISKTMKYVGTGFGVISHSANVLSSLLSDRINVKVIYKLLWHLLKCHRGKSTNSFPLPLLTFQVFQLITIHLPKMSYKFLERLGDASTKALMYLLVDDGSTASSSVPLQGIIVPNSTLLGGFRLYFEGLEDQLSKNDVATTLARQNIRNIYGVSTVLRLLRFLSNEQKERWLFDFLALILASPKSVNVILSCDDWQPCLFQLVAEVVEEINGGSSNSNGVNGTHGTQRNDTDAAKRSNINDLSTRTSEGNTSESYYDESSHLVSEQSNATPVAYHASSNKDVPTVNTQPLSKPSVRTRYDLSLKLYSSLLAHCVRQGDEKAFEAVEMAASLQRVDANGSEVFSILLSHLLADLIEKGTVASIETTYTYAESINVRNRALKQSARLVTQAILSNGSEGLDMASAVRQWRCLRHLTAVAVAVVSANG